MPDEALPSRSDSGNRAVPTTPLATSRGIVPLAEEGELQAFDQCCRDQRGSAITTYGVNHPPLRIARQPHDPNRSDRLLGTDGLFHHGRPGGGHDADAGISAGSTVKSYNRENSSYS